jgi:hypothetical protein
VGEVIPVGSLRPIRTAHKTLGGHILEHPSCGGFMPTAETTLIPASGNQRATKRFLTSNARLDNEPNLCEVALKKVESRTALSTSGVKPQVIDEERIEGVVDVRRTGRRIVVEVLFLAEDDFSPAEPPQI